MSHVVSIESKLHDPAAVSAACRRLGLAVPTERKVRLFSNEETGLAVELPGWQYPIVIDTLSGQVKYDNFNGHWGNKTELEKFFQMYSVEKCRIEAQKKGYQVTEQALQDGSIRLQVIEAA